MVRTRLFPSLIPVVVATLLLATAAARAQVSLPGGTPSRWYRADDRYMMHRSLTAIRNTLTS